MGSVQDSLALILSGLVYGLSGGLAPGPTTALLIAQSLRHGAGEGFKIAIAPLITDAPIILVALLAVHLVSGGVLLGLVSACGALFLLYLAWDTFHARPPTVDDDAAPTRSVLKGVTANFFNPHPWMFWVSVGAPTVLRGWEIGAHVVSLFLLGLYGCLVGAKMVMALATARGRSFVTGRGYVFLMRGLALALAVYAIMLGRDALRMLLQGGS